MFLTTANLGSPVFWTIISYLFSPVAMERSQRRSSPIVESMPSESGHREVPAKNGIDVQKEAPSSPKPTPKPTPTPRPATPPTANPAKSSSVQPPDDNNSRHFADNPSVAPSSASKSTTAAEKKPTPQSEPNPGPPSNVDQTSSKPSPIRPNNSSSSDEGTQTEHRRAYVGVLPCGLRLITTEDNTLPVAAVMLAIEIGTRDDPPKLPGLVHALAYHLQQGNRELPPGGLLTEIHDAGGMASMAVGFAQVRYGSLVPISHLQRTIWLEAQRLRAPTIESGLWLKSLHFAGKDVEERKLPPPELLAAAWQEMVPSTDSRGVSTELAQLTMQEVASHLARFFDYRRSTLIVVGPKPPEQLWKMAAQQFADLPARPRFPFRNPFPQQSQHNEIRLQIPTLPPNVQVWPVPLDPERRFWSRVLCGVFDHRIVNDAIGKPQRIRCKIRDDARRPLMQVRVSGNAKLEGGTYIRSQYQELQSDTYQEIATVQASLEFATHAPIELATRLAFVPDFAFGLKTTPFMIELPNLLGIPQTQTMTQLPRALFELLERSHSVYVNPPTAP